MSHASGTVSPKRSAARHSVAAKSGTLVWIDSRDAYIVRWHDDAARVAHLVSDVPAHHRTTGAGSGSPQEDVEGRRLEHLAHFVAQAAAYVQPGDDVLVVGPGTVRDHLAQEIAQADLHTHRIRRVACRAAAPMTERQLIAMLRIEIGEPPPRKKHTRRQAHKAVAEPVANPYAELEELDEHTDQEV